MKKLIMLQALALFFVSSFAQKPNYDEVADLMVNQSLKVTKGEMVIIYGTPDLQEMVQAVYVAVYKAGGLPSIQINYPDADVRVSKETKPEYLAQSNYADAVMRRMADCIINIDSNTDPDRWKDISPEVRKAYWDSGKVRREMSQHDRLRIVSLGQTDGIPTRQVADAFGADFDQMQKNFWMAVAVDYDKLKARADKVVEKFKPGSQAKVTTPYGTNISFRLYSNAPMTSCGSTMDQQRSRGDNYAWLPAGDVFTAIDPSSANGTVVMPAYYMGSTKLSNLTIVYKNGQIQSIRADQDVSKLKERLLARGAESAMLSSIDLGINPLSKVIGDYRSFEMAGMVSLGGGSNPWAGGDYFGGSDYFFHLKDATVEIGGASVVKDGALSGL